MHLFHNCWCFVRDLLEWCDFCMVRFLKAGSKYIFFLQDKSLKAAHSHSTLFVGNNVMQRRITTTIC